jgi:dUTPase
MNLTRLRGKVDLEAPEDKGEMLDVSVVDELPKTERGDGGFGSTGK